MYIIEHNQFDYIDILILYKMYIYVVPLVVDLVLYLIKTMNTRNTCKVQSFWGRVVSPSVINLKISYLKKTNKDLKHIYPNIYIYISK